MFLFDINPGLFVLGTIITGLVIYLVGESLWYLLSRRWAKAPGQFPPELTTQKDTEDTPAQPAPEVPTEVILTEPPASTAEADADAEAPPPPPVDLASGHRIQPSPGSRLARDGDAPPHLQPGWPLVAPNDQSTALLEVIAPVVEPLEIEVHGRVTRRHAHSDTNPGLEPVVVILARMHSERETARASAADTAQFRIIR